MVKNQTFDIGVKEKGGLGLGRGGQMLNEVISSQKEE